MLRTTLLGGLSAIMGVTLAANGADQDGKSYLETRLIITGTWTPSAPDKGTFGSATPLLRASQESRTETKSAAAIGTIGAAAVQTLVGAGIGFASNLLSTIGDAKSEKADANASVHFYSYDQAEKAFVLNQTVRSIFVVRGRFTDDEKSPAPSKFSAAWQNDDKQNFAKAVHLAETPQMVFEGLLRPSLDNGKFEIVPIYFEVNRNQDWSLFTGKRDFVISFTFSDPSITDTEKSGFAIGNIAFTDVRAPQTISVAQMEGKTTGWMNIPALSGATRTLSDMYAAFDSGREAAMRKNAEWNDAQAPQRNRLALLSAQLSWPKEQQKERQEIYDLQLGLDRAANADDLEEKYSDERRKLLLAALRDVQPVNIAVQVTETRKANAYLQKLGAALKGSIDANKTTLQAAAENQLTGAADDAARTARTAAVKDARSKYKLLLDAKKTFDSATDTTERKKAYADVRNADDDYAEALLTARRAGAAAGTLPPAPPLPPEP